MFGDAEGEVYSFVQLMCVQKGNERIVNCDLSEVVNTGNEGVRFLDSPSDH